MATAAGYILADDNEIWGVGTTPAEAEYDARIEGSRLDHDGEEIDDWLDSLYLLPATAALLDAAWQNRRTPYRRLAGGVWGTPAEYAAGE